MVPRNPSRETATPSTPQQFPATTPTAYPGSDYSFTLQAVMEMQKTVGGLEHSVKSLEVQTEKLETKIGDIAKDVHTVKITARIIGAVLAGAIAFAGWGIGKAVDVFVDLHQNQPTIQANPTSPQK